jgi:hypothetical protein
VRHRLEDRQALIEDVEFVERPEPARPGQLLGDLERGVRAVLDAVGGGSEPLLVMGQQLVDPVMDGRGDRAVRGKQPRVRQRADEFQRPEVVAQR